MKKISTIGFDADDTLWHNEHYFTQAHVAFKEVMANFIEGDALYQILLDRERANVETLGYGIKSFTLSMMEAALSASDHKMTALQMQSVINIGREMTREPVKLLDGVSAVLDDLVDKYELVLITKGDLVDQERKVTDSGLSDYFQGVEIVSEKGVDTYRTIFARHGGVERSVMVGNSVKSDVLPAINAGAWGVHVPYVTTWALEHAEPDLEHERYFEAGNISEAVKIIKAL